MTIKNCILKQRICLAYQEENDVLFIQRLQKFRSKQVFFAVKRILTFFFIFLLTFITSMILHVWLNGSVVSVLLGIRDR